MPRPYGVCNEAQYRDSLENTYERTVVVFLQALKVESENLDALGGGGGCVSEAGGLGLHVSKLKPSAQQHRLHLQVSSSCQRSGMMMKPVCMCECMLIACAHTHA